MLTRNTSNPRPVRPYLVSALVRAVVAVIRPVAMAAGFVAGLFFPRREKTGAQWQAYRKRLRAAAARGDEAFLDAEIRKNQLTRADLARLRNHQTPVHLWPDVEADDLFEPGTFAEAPEAAPMPAPARATS